jgi:glycine/D-amino acid oxidase-like deaminating enzyme
MSDKLFDILIAGSGPIAASTAYFISQEHPELTVGVVSREPSTDNSAAYTQAGGSLRWTWESRLKSEMTSETAKFIKDLSNKGVDLALLEDHYLYLYTGQFHESLNFSGKKLVDYLIGQAKAQGVEVFENAAITAVHETPEFTELETSAGRVKGKRVLLALGAANAEYMPNSKLELEKRQLFVLDKPIDELSTKFPHIIGRIGDDGYVYVFLKQTPRGLRYIVGQEDIIEDDETGLNDYWQALLDAGAADVLPFLRDAKVESIWWGFDAANKELIIEEGNGRLFAANCGSAARSAAWIGKAVAMKLTSVE